MLDAEAIKQLATPLYDRVFVLPDEDKVEKTEGGLYIPEVAKEKPLEGTVLAVGAGRLLDSGDLRPLTVKPGDRVMYGRYSGSEVKLARGNAVLIMREDELLAILKPEAAEEPAAA
jgi:chaperonin GroES